MLTTGSLRACFLFYVKHVLQYVNGHAGNVSITTFSKICSVPVSILIIIKSPATANEKIFSVCSYTIQFYSSLNICQTYTFSSTTIVTYDRSSVDGGITTTSTCNSKHYHQPSHNSCLAVAYGSVKVGFIKEYKNMPTYNTQM